MDNLKEIRNELLNLHKTLLEIERANYEAKFGKITNIQLLNLLFQDQNFLWLREISALVAEIDEFFASKEGIKEALGQELFSKSKRLFEEDAENEEFKDRFKANLDTESRVEDHHQRLMNLYEKEKA